MADLAKQLRQLNNAQRLRELANQYGYGQVSDQDLNALRQALPQMAGQAMGQLPPAQMPQYMPPTSQMPSPPVRDYALRPKEYGALPPVPMPTIPQGMTPADMNAMRQAAPQPGAAQMSPYMQNLTNPGQTMQQNYIDPAIIEQMYYRGLLSR
jgi:hypothetical protein